MSDPTAPDRHQRHEAAFESQGRRLDELETESLVNRLWRNGNGDPHRGAESRLYRLEEEAVLRNEMKQIATEVVTAYLRSFRGVLQTAAPYVMILVGVVYWIVTGQPPKVGP